MQNAVVGQAEVYIAQALGYFTKNHVDVTINSGVGATALTLVTSGKADLTAFGASSPAASVIAGNKMSIVYAITADGIGGSVYALKSSNVKTLEDLSGKKVGTLAPPGSAYGDASVLNKVLVAEGLKPYTIVTYPSLATISAAMLSGQTFATVGANNFFTAAVAQGTVVPVMDASDPALRQKYYGGSELPANVFFGVTSNLQAKRPAVTAFLKSVDEAQNYLVHSTPDQIASTLKTLDAFGSQALPNVTSDATLTQPYFLPTGYISSSAWSQVLKNMDQWGLSGYSSSDSQFSYENLVDMSYLKAAGGVPAGN